MNFFILVSVFIIFLQYCYTCIINIESANIPDELIYHSDITTSYIKNNS